MYRLGISACCRPLFCFLDEVGETGSWHIACNSHQPADLLNYLRERGPPTLDPQKQMILIDSDGNLVAVRECYPTCQFQEISKVESD